jgi:hypothetical protein
MWFFYGRLDDPPICRHGLWSKVAENTGHEVCFVSRRTVRLQGEREEDDFVGPGVHAESVELSRVVQEDSERAVNRRDAVLECRTKDGVVQRPCHSGSHYRPN